MKLFELLLLFIRASRDQLWELHLQSLHAFCPYFFALDMINYARTTPVYLSQMYAIKEKDPQTWEFLSDGGFSVNKLKVQFSSIGSDHGIEQENRGLKVTGGIRGIAHSQQALDEYFLTTVEMENIVESFCEKFGIEENQSLKKDEHYQLSCSKNQRIHNNTEKISSVITDYEVFFDECENVFSVLTKKVLPQKTTKTFLKVEEIGQERYESFVTEKLKD